MFVEKLERIFFYLLLLFLPTQLGKHFWPDFSIVSGIRIDYLSPTVYVTDILVGLLFLTWLMRKVQNARFVARRAKFKLQFLTFNFAFFILLFFYLLLNIALSHNLLNGMFHLLKFLEFSFVAYYVASTVKNMVQLKRIVFLLGIGVCGESLLAIAQFLNQGSINGVFYFLGERTFTAATPGIANASIHGELVLRPYGTFSHPNVLAGYLLLSMICLLFTIVSIHQRAEKIFWVITMFLGTSVLLLSMSRVAIVVWIFLLVFLLTITLLQKKKAATKVLAETRNAFLVILTVLAVLGILISPLGARFLQTSSGEEAVVQRVDLIRASTQLVGQEPVGGIGFGNFIPMLPTMQKPLAGSSYLQPVHNIFLLVLVETGVIGFGFFVWFFVKTYQMLFHLAKSPQVLPYRLFIVLLTVVLLLGSFDHYFVTLQQGQLLFALVVGLCWIRMEKLDGSLKQ